jgi:hypothetical protein
MKRETLRTLGLAHVMFRQVRAYIANDSDSAGHATVCTGILEIDVGQRMLGGVADDEAGVRFPNGPRRREAARRA